MLEKRNYDYKMDEAEIAIKLNHEKAPHPSEIFEFYLKKAYLNTQPANKIAKILGISRTAYYDFLNAENGISPDIAIRLARFFYDFDPKLYPHLSSAAFWWKLNCAWLFDNWLLSANSRAKKNNVGVTRYKVDENNRISTVNEIGELIIDDSISIQFKQVNSDNSPQ